MRWIILILGMVVSGGCADHASTLQSTSDGVVQWLRDWWNGKVSSSGSTYEYESDESKAHHEQTVIRTLNGWIGNQPYN